MRDINMLDWPSDLSALTLMVDSLDVSKDQLQQIINDQKHDADSIQLRPIVVEMLDLRWLFAAKKNFVAFSMLLSDMPASFYTTKFTVMLLDNFWQQTQRKIFWR